MPRIIAGKRKKMNLKIVPGKDVRPTTDRIKENVFNLISGWIAGCDFLDLFAGTGQIGLEALSRDAKSCIFVERNRTAYGIMMTNIDKSGFENYRAMCKDSLRFLETTSDRFDVIYIDPPYASGIYEELFYMISKNDILKHNGILIVEHSVDNDLKDKYDTLEKYDQRKYGDTNITLMRKGKLNE